MAELEIHWQEHDLDDICRFFANGFNPKNGKKIIRYEFFVDEVKRVVVFKMYIEKGN